MRKREDRRVLRTQQTLRTALLSLIRERGFEGLSVQDIIDRANVGRATFYAHFDNKEDLLASGFEDLRSALRKRQAEARSHGKSIEDRVFGFSYELFVHVSEHRDVFRNMVGKHSGSMVQQLLHRIVVDLVRDDIKSFQGKRETDAVPMEALVQYLAGGLFGLLMWWLESRPRMDPEQVNSIFRRWAVPAMKSIATA